VGGNESMATFLKAHGVVRDSPITEKYKSEACIAYRIILRARALIKPVPDADGAIKAAKEVISTNKWDLDVALQNATSYSSNLSEPPQPGTSPAEDAAAARQKVADEEEACKRKEADIKERADAARERKLKVQESIKKAPPATKTTAERLMDFYKKHAPENATEEKVSAALLKYKGNEAKMWKILNQKYLKPKQVYFSSLFFSMHTRRSLIVFLTLRCSLVGCVCGRHYCRC